VFEGDWTPSSGEEGLYQLLRGTPDIDAVFASNDQMALGVMHAAHRLGLRIPDELSVVGVDDIAEGSHFWPPLTTVQQPLSEAGALAVEVVVRAIRASRPGRQAEDTHFRRVNLLQPTLIVRQSSRQVAPG
jgi:LacI family transcriptional regulator